MQEEKLYDDQKQEEDPGQIGIKKILSFLPDPYGAQGNQVG
jgi:hypothetical protein